MNRWKSSLAACALAGISANQALALTYFWDADGANSAATGGSGPWDTSSLLWRVGLPAGPLSAWPNIGSDNDAVLGGGAGTLTLSTGISVNDLTVNPSTAGTGSIAGATQTLTLNGATQSVLDVASGSTLAVTAGFAGLNGFTKNSAGTLILDAPGGLNGLVGAITLNAGTLQAGSATNNGASQALRSNAVNLASGAGLTTAGSPNDLRIGSLSGAGSITPGTGGAINELALADSAFSGAITTTGGLNLRGSNGTTQSFNGNLTGLTGTVGLSAGSTILLSGSGSTSGVLAAPTLITRGGSLVLDNTGGNTSAAAGRLADNAAVTLGGGSISLLGNSAGSAETVGAFTMNSGASTISVTNNGGTGATLAFTDSGSLRDQTSGTLNFVGLGTGTLGAAGNAPRITFSGSISANTTNGALANASSATTTTIGWARVNGTSWAGLGSNGIAALAETARNSSTLSSAAPWELTTFTPSATTTTLSAALGTATTPLLLKLTPSAAGQSLATGGNAINAVAVMLAGATDFSITGTGTLFGTVGSTHYAYVTDANAVLSATSSVAGASNPITKAGAGALFLNGTVNQLGFTSVQNVNLLEGVLRGTTTSLGGGTAAGGANTNINLYGGVLEISGGGTLTRALGTNSIVGTASGGTIKWDNNNANARGEGGFSAIGGNATVTLVTTVGGATPAAPIWNDTGFLQNGYALVFGSTKSDSRVELTNNLGLDDGTASANYFAREVRVVAGAGGDSARLSGVISGSANTDLLKTGGGALELTNSNTFAGNTLIQQGTLITTNGSALPDTGAVILANGSGATLKLNSNETIGALSGGGTIGGNVNLQANTLTVGDQRDSTFAGVISGSGGALAKQGSGTLTVAGANTYTGGTNISGGTVAVTGTLASTSGVIVTSGGTLLLNNSSTNAIGVGNTTPVSLAGGAVKLPDALNGNSQYLGALTLSATSTLDLGSTSGTAAGNSFDFASLALGGNVLNVQHWSGSPYGLGTTVDANSDATQDRLLFVNDPGFALGQDISSIHFLDDNGAPLGDGMEVRFSGPGGGFEIVAVPEPSTICGALGLAGLIGWRERRRLAAVHRAVMKRA